MKVDTITAVCCAVEVAADEYPGEWSGGNPVSAADIFNLTTAASAFSLITELSSFVPLGSTVNVSAMAEALTFVVSAL